MELRLTTRVALVVLGVDSLYSSVVPAAYIQMLHLPAARERWTVLSLVVLLSLVKTSILVAVLPGMLRPIEAWRTATSSADDEAGLLAAWSAVHRTQTRFTFITAAAWGALYPVATLTLLTLLSHRVTLPPHATLATLFLAGGCLGAAVPLAATVLGTLLAPTAARVSLAARDRGLRVPVNGPSFTLRVSLAAGLLGVAPTLWMCAIALAPAPGHGAIGYFAAVALLWVPVCGWFIARAVATPIAKVSSVVRQIAARGHTRDVGRVPIYWTDELGALAEAINDMVDRLDQAAREQLEAQEQFEELAAVATRRAGQLEAVLQNMVDGVLVSDEDGRVALANAAARRNLGASKDDGPLHVAQLAGRLHARRSDGASFAPGELPLARALEGEVALQVDEIVQPEGGDHDRVLRVTASPLRDARGAVVGAVSVERDITEQFEMERLKEQFVGVAAHELKTPVAIMKGYAQLLRRDRARDRAKALDAIARGADRIDRIVGDLLDASQLALGCMQLDTKRVDLAALVAREVDRASARSPRHHVSVRTQPAEAFVDGDERRLAQVLANVLDNAVRYSPGGGDIDVDVSVEKDAAKVVVTDHGVGIPKERQARLFEKFYRAHTDTRYDFGGIGIGLYLSREIVKEHGGAMGIVSDEGRGTQVSILLPLRRGRHDGA